VQESSLPIEGNGDLVEYFVDAETPVEDWKVGTEHEKIGIYADTHARVTYDGPCGIGALLERVAAVDGWERVLEGPNLIALKKGGASITLEPGGQLELSGAPLRDTRETCAEFNDHVKLLQSISDDMGILWLGIGHDPIHHVDQTPKMPKARYDIMRGYLPTRGDLSLHMMHSTATVQANYDFSSEADMASKMRAAMACTTPLSALFANGPIAQGKENGFVSRRLHIWRDTDPDRCGILEFVFEPDFGYRDYIEWALDIPMFFIVRDHQYLPATRLTFRNFMQNGMDGHRATIGDWDTHLTTLFPEIRLKRIVEVRGTDAVSREMICALPALWKGILYDAGARDAVWSLVGGASAHDRDDGLVDVARRGLAADFAGRPVLELARELVAISEAGLAAMIARGEADVSETGFLDPLHAVIERGLSPGEQTLESWRGEWNGSMDRLIASAKY